METRCSRIHLPPERDAASSVSTGNKMRGGIERALPIEGSVHYCRWG